MRLTRQAPSDLVLGRPLFRLPMRLAAAPRPTRPAPSRTRLSSTRTRGPTSPAPLLPLKLRPTRTAPPAKAEMRCVDPTSFAPSMARTPRTSSSMITPPVVDARECISRWYSTLDLLFADSRPVKIPYPVIASAARNGVFLVLPVRVLFPPLVRRLLLLTRRS